MVSNKKFKMSRIEKLLLIGLIFVSSASAVSSVISQFNKVTSGYYAVEFFLMVLFVSLFGCFSYLKNTNFKNKYITYFKYYVIILTVIPFMLGFMDGEVFKITLKSFLLSFLGCSLVEFLALNFFTTLGVNISYVLTLDKFYKNKFFMLFVKIIVYIFLGVVILLFILSRFSFH